MNKISLPKLATEQLNEILDLSGSVLYSSHETLKSHDVYLMGLNPGGEEDSSIRDSIGSMLTNLENAYVDEEWSAVKTDYEKGEAPLQKRIKFLLSELGHEPKSVCASNLIFVRSRDAQSLSFNKLAEICWPVHEAILSIVKPKLILAFGNSGISPYRFLHNKLRGDKEQSFSASHGNWSIKSFTSGNGKLGVIGIPHLSRYCPINKEDAMNQVKNRYKELLFETSQK